MGSVLVPHWLDLNNVNFRKNAAFKSYGVKTKSTGQYADEHGLPRPDSARFQHGGGSVSNTNGEYALLVCYLRTYLARVFTVLEKLVELAAYLYHTRIRAITSIVGKGREECVQKGR